MPNRGCEKGERLLRVRLNPSGQSVCNNGNKEGKIIIGRVNSEINPRWMRHIKSSEEQK